MKYSIAAVSALGLVAAQPHAHRHRHQQRRDVTYNDVSEVVYVCELNGVTIPQAECDEGVRNGTLKMNNEGAVVDNTITIGEEEEPQPETYEEPEQKSNDDGGNAEPEPKPKEEPKAESKSDDSSSSGGSSTSGGDGVNRDFPDGEVDCSDFPDQYGALNLDYLNLGGWSGIQNPKSDGSSGYDDIETVVSDQCSGSDCCSDGMYCSYACPAGYQKSQWPEQQGATGQSVGGIKCKNGKLHLTNPGMSKKLCVKGTDAVTIKVQNKIKKGVSVCRTDYPGTESETVPVDAQPGGSYELACPDADNYYNWLGQSTSAQYYLNPADVSVDKACQWGSPENPWGNYAPSNLGVGYSGGKGWISLFHNSPTVTESVQLDYTVEIVGEGGGFDNVVGRCRYKNGQYCSGENYDNCNKIEGCTVTVLYGEATFEFS